MESKFLKEVQFFPSLEVEVSLPSVTEKLRALKNADKIHSIAHQKLKEMQGQWQPAALIRYFDIHLNPKMGTGSIRQKSGEAVSFNWGYSSLFLKPATHAMVSVHGIGEKLDLASAKASARGELLEAYVIELIGLTVLEKTTDIIKGMAEDQARKMGWGVSPFLSPGSVHGWDLEEQSKLCKLLPIDKINVTMKNNCVLYPLKTISGLIGIGSAYEADTVGSTCDVCSKRETCQMNQHHLSGTFANERS
ncbi:MAG: hypothetical protein HUK40_13365 [Desulfobacter sp.]|nr:hypothetical protein [Desulfobacter sp.]